MNENSDALPHAPAEYTPLGADLAAPGEINPEFYKPKPEDEATVLPSSATDEQEASVVAHSNRTAALWISLAGGIVFALLFLLATMLYSWAAFTWGDQVAGRDVYSYIQTRSLNFVSTPAFWLTSVAFYVFFTVFAMVFYRAQWRTYVIGALVVALLTYASAIGAGLLTISAWTLSFSEAIAVMWRSIAFNPLILVSLILAREVPIWFGGWIALRAKKLRDKDLSS